MVCVIDYANEHKLRVIRNIHKLLTMTCLPREKYFLNGLEVHRFTKGNPLFLYLLVRNGVYYVDFYTKEKNSPNFVAII